MAIPIAIDKLLTENVVEWGRIEFKESWNPDTTLKTISAFANDLDNWGGGYVVVGAGEENGRLIRPVTGIAESEIDTIQKELLQYCKYLRPSYVPVSEPVSFDGKMLLLVWCPGGYDRPYACPKKPSSKHSEKVFYIRKLSSTIEASDADRRELVSMAHNVPFDDRINPRATMSDLKYPLIRNYLQNVGSGLLETAADATAEQLAVDLRVADGPIEYFKPLNVGLLFFNDKPEKFFPYARIEIVSMPDPTGQGMEEVILDGPLDEQLKGALAYLRRNVIAEKVFKIDGRAEAVRVWNYSYGALEEFVSNAVYHRSYQEHEPVTIRIESECIEITSVPGPDRSISDEDIANLRMRSRRYRNRRIGDFLRELDLVEGRNTGIPTAIRETQANGSPMPRFLTDEDRTFFSVIVPIHDAFKGFAGNRGFAKDYVGDREKGLRKSREEIKREIMGLLQDGPKTMSQMYRAMGYSGNASKTFRACVDELFDGGSIVVDEGLSNEKATVYGLRSF